MDYVDSLLRRLRPELGRRGRGGRGGGDYDDNDSIGNGDDVDDGVDDGRR